MPQRQIQSELGFIPATGNVFLTIKYRESLSVRLGNDTQSKIVFWFGTSNCDQRLDCFCLARTRHLE